MYLPIKLQHGVGDCLNEINRWPLRYMGLIGFNPRFYYTTPDHGAHEIIIPLLKQVRGASVATAPFPHSLTEHRVANVLSRLFKALKWDFSPPLIGFDEMGDRKDKVIIVQTHMDGHHQHKQFSAKIWSIDKWTEFLQKLIQASGCKIKLMEWDRDSREALLRNVPGLLDATAGNLVEKCREIQECELLVSIDSWSKYVAHWFKTPQVVIVPDLRVGYVESFRQIDGHCVADNWFIGLLENKNVKIIGLERRGKRYEYSLQSLNDLAPSYLLEATLSMLSPDCCCRQYKERTAA